MLGGMPFTFGRGEIGNNLSLAFHLCRSSCITLQFFFEVYRKNICKNLKNIDLTGRNND
jgi:hypothetical protein